MLRDLSFNVGERVNLGALLCTRYSNYQALSWDREHEETRHRYCFKDSNNIQYVYSGKYLNCKVGEYYSIRATIKRIENGFNNVRLARVKLITNGLTDLLL